MLDKVQFAVESGLNALFIGKHGVGKTKGPISKLKEMGYTDDPSTDNENIYSYFNCPVMDVHEDIKGIPVNQDGKLVYIKPEHRAWEKVKVIILDEPNRAHIKVVNTMYELIQLRSVNGIKLPNLRCIIAAMNPPDEEYTVENCDQSFYDRFHLHINVKAKLCPDFFQKVKGLNEAQFERMKLWWQAIPEKTRDKFASPRRIEMCVDVFKFGGEIADVIPQSCNPDKLTEIFSGNQNVRAGDMSVKNIEAAKNFLANYDNDDYRAGFMDNLKNCPKEILASHFNYNKGSETEKMRTAQEMMRFVKYIAFRYNIKDAIPLFEGVPSLLVTTIKNTSFTREVRVLALESLKKSAPALATKFEVR